MAWYVYILKCADGSLYTGVTTDIARRVDEHNHAKRAAAYTRGRRPVRLAYVEQLADRSAAGRREAEIKSLRRQAKQALIKAKTTDMADCIRPIDAAQKARVEERTRDYIQQVGRLFGREFAPIPIAFDLKGRAAGMYKVRNGERVIRYNPWLFAKYYQDSLVNTVPHEVAHYVVDCLYDRQRVRPHGPEWRGVMQGLGAECRVTGRYDLAGIPLRKHRRFAYACGCRTHALGSIRHKRIQRGAAYHCQHCHAAIRPLDKLPENK